MSGAISIWARSRALAQRAAGALLVILAWPFRGLFRPRGQSATLGERLHILVSDTEPCDEATEVIVANKRERGLRSSRSAGEPSAILIFPDVDLVAVAPRGDAEHDARVFELLHGGRRSKLLDLRPALELALPWFEQLASAWRASRRGTPRRLAIVLDYERWALWDAAILRALAPLSARGVEVGVFYAQQAHQLRRWFEHGEVSHNVNAVRAWLRYDWPSSLGRGERPAALPPASRDWSPQVEEGWAEVLRRTDALLVVCAPIAELPVLRLELAQIAAGFGEPAGSREALYHLSRAMDALGDAPSQVKYNVLCAMARAHLERDEPADALAQFARAVEVAIALHHVSDAVLALLDSARIAVRWRQHREAESKLRRALSLGHIPQDLRATLLHLLARAMLDQGKVGAETLQVAEEALRSRSSAMSEAANQDRMLMVSISARMHDAPTQPKAARYGK